MTNVIFLFGTFSGLIVIAAIIATMGLDLGHSGVSEYLGYLIMIVALSMIFFGVKRYRDQERGGVIKFVPALMIGIGISAVAGVIYVLVWEVYLVATNYAFMDVYTNEMIESARAKGETGAALDAMIKEFQDLKVQYQDPLFRLPMTFLEIFPVGLLISLITAAILRNPKVMPARS